MRTIVCLALFILNLQCFKTFVNSAAPKCDYGENSCTCTGDITTVPDNCNKNIQKLSLTCTNVNKHFGTNYFDKYPNVVSLKFSKCMELKPRSTEFDSLHQLETLDLSGTFLGISKKHYPNFCLDKLTNLNLSSTQLSISIFQVLTCPKIRNLDLSKNLITSISVDDIAPLCNLQSINLSDNPILEDSSCKCHILTKWLREHNINAIGNITCDKPQSCSRVKYSQKTVALMNRCRQLKQDPQSRLIAYAILVGLCIIVLLISVIIGLVWYCRKYKVENSIDLTRDTLVEKHNNANQINEDTYESKMNGDTECKSESEQEMD